MVIKYNIDIDNAAIIKNLDRVTNLIFKLLPLREEELDWETPLRNLTIELIGMSELLKDKVSFFQLLCKMEALAALNREEDFLDFRKVIFECLGLIGEIKQCL